MDRWGRPTFNDGFNLAKGIRSVENWQYQDKLREQDQADRKIDKDSFAVSKMLYDSKGEADLSEFGPEAQMKGRDKFIKMKTDDILAKNAELQNDTGWKQNKVATIKLNIEEGKRKYQQLLAAYQANDEEKFYAIAQDLNNKNVYNGIHVGKDENGYTMTNWGGESNAMDRPPMKDVIQEFGTYFAKTDQELMQHSLRGDELIRYRNQNTIQQGHSVIDPKTGMMAWYVPPGTVDPKDGSRRGAMYIDPITEEEIPVEKMKGALSTEQYNTMVKEQRLANKDATEAAIKIRGQDIDALDKASPKSGVDDMGNPYMLPQTPEQKQLGDVARKGLGVKVEEPSKTQFDLPNTFEIPEGVKKTSELVKHVMENNNVSEEEAKAAIGRWHQSQTPAEQADKKAAEETKKAKPKKAKTPQEKKEPTLPEDINDWEVTMVSKDGKRVPVVITDDGPVYITKTQYDTWRNRKGGAKGMKWKAPTKVSSVPHTMPKMY